jgi:hypothetical protein
MRRWGGLQSISQVARCLGPDDVHMHNPHSFQLSESSESLGDVLGLACGMACLGRVAFSICTSAAHSPQPLLAHPLFASHRAVACRRLTLAALIPMATPQPASSTPSLPVQPWPGADQVQQQRSTLLYSGFCCPLAAFAPAPARSSKPTVGGKPCPHSTLAIHPPPRQPSTITMAGVATYPLFLSPRLLVPIFFPLFCLRRAY